MVIARWAAQRSAKLATAAALLCLLCGPINAFAEEADQGIGEGLISIYDRAAEPTELTNGVESRGSFIASGECGDQGANVTWGLDQSGHLFITGTGRMADWSSPYAETGGMAPNWKTGWKAYQVNEITVEDGVTYIGEFSFASMYDVKSVFLSDSVKEIGKQAFANCLELTSMRLPTKGVEIANSIMSNCKALTYLYIPDGITGGYRGGCLGLGRNANVVFEFAPGIKRMDGLGYSGALKSIVLPDTVEEIVENAFIGWSALETVDIPASTIRIANASFAFCPLLTTVTIRGNAYIEERAFDQSNVQLIKCYKGSPADVFGAENNIERDYLEGDPGTAHPPTPDPIVFSDVNSSTPHVDDILWLASTGISEGWLETDGTRTFRGMSTVVRQDMAAFLHRLAVAAVDLPTR